MKNQKGLSFTNFFKKNSEGFTIIELIVVILIISVLAAIVLINVTKYINKGKDASMKGNMNSLLVNAAVYYDKNKTLVNFSNDEPLYDGPVKSIKKNTGKIVASSNDVNEFCATVQLFDETIYCVDFKGFKGTITSGCPVGGLARCK